MDPLPETRKRTGQIDLIIFNTTEIVKVTRKVSWLKTEIIKKDKKRTKDEVTNVKK